MGMALIRKAFPDDAPSIHKIAESLRYRPPGSEKGFLVHVRSIDGYRRILDISQHSFVTEEEGRVVGFLLVHTMPELKKLRKDLFASDKVVEYVLGIDDGKAVYADQIGVDLECRSRGIGQQLASAMMSAHPGARFLAAIMHKPTRNLPSLRLALRNGWRARDEVSENGFIWGIYELE